MRRLFIGWIVMTLIQLLAVSVWARQDATQDPSKVPPTAAATQEQPPPGQSPPGERRPPRPSPPQPQQKQTIDYFAGRWSYQYLGRDSALGPAPRECTATFTKRPDGKSVEGATECKHEGGTYRDHTEIVFDEAAKMLTFTEKLGSGITLHSRGDWTSPISIRFTVDQVEAEGRTLRLRRVISVVSAHSFTITEELSENGEAFIRLGNAVVTKIDAK